MKSKHLFLRVKRNSLAFGAAILLFSSCVDGYKDDKTFSPGVQGVTLESPSTEGWTFTRNVDITSLEVTWPVVFGAGGYQVTFYNVDDPENPVVIGPENEVVDKCKITRDITPDTRYKVVVKTLGNDKYNNSDAVAATEMPYNTLVPLREIIPSGTNLTTYFTNNPIAPLEEGEEEVAYELVAGGNYEMDGNVDLGTTTLTIRGDKVNHAKITMKGNASFINHGAGLKVKFIDFDFDESTYTASNSRGLVMFNAAEAGVVQQPYVFQSCNLTNMRVPLYYCNNGYGLAALTVDDCLVSISEASAIFIAFNGQGWIKDLFLTNSTIYYTVPGSAYLVQMRGRVPSNFSGSGWSASLRKMNNCTFYRVGNTNGRFFNNVINSNNAVFSLEMQNTIFADCVVGSATGTEGVFRRICNAGNYGNVNYTLAYNTYYYSAVPGGFLDYDTSDDAGRDHSGTAIKVAPQFADAANGDFTLRSSEHIANRCGDPRWLPATE